MKGKAVMIFIFFWMQVIYLFAQPKAMEINGTSADTARVSQLLNSSKEQLSVDPQKAIVLAEQAKVLAEKVNFLQGKAFALKNIGLGNYLSGKYPEALQFWQQSLEVFEEIKDQTGIANMLNNIAAIYVERGDDEKGLGYSLRSLKISEELGDKLRILSALNTVGSIYYNKIATRDKALDYLLRALPLCEAIGDNEALGTISENIGEIYLEKNDYSKALNYFNQSIKALGKNANSAYAYNGIGKVYLKQGNFNKALVFHNKALSISEELNSKTNMVRSLQSIADLYMEQQKFATALPYYKQASVIADEIKANPSLKDIYRGMSDAYAKIADYKNAFIYKAKYADIKDTLYNTETDKKLGSLQFEFDLEKKQGEITLLTKDKALTSLELKRQRYVTIGSMIGIVMVAFIALLIYRNFRAKVKTNKILDKQKGQIEDLLLNILPSEVANELQEKGHSESKYFESVSVMFTDFKGFTMMADKMTPQHLVAELNESFMAFDEIIGRNNLEKIKTIGDSYMCAGGIPTLDENHIDNMVKASLEINEFIVGYNIKRIQKGLEPWALRIGIHIGPVVAGVVGKKKYAYDIWGSTVNIASRMESSGMPGKVNISSSFYDMIKDRYRCTYRGKINAKNVGDIDMYFLEDEIHKFQDAKSLPVAENETV